MSRNRAEMVFYAIYDYTVCQVAYPLVGAKQASEVPFLMYYAADTLLGGSKILPNIPQSPLDWVALLRQGIPSAAVDSVAGFAAISRTELSSALGIPERTLARRKREGRLNAEESAKLLRLARVIERAEQVFEGLELALDWLKSPNASLTGVPPLSLLDTDIGAETVLDLLGRIEHGVFF